MAQDLGTKVQPAVKSSAWLYDSLIVVFTTVFHIFFRQIQTRGTYKIPHKGPVIFVAAPHSNQFVDPLMIMTNIFNMTRRRVSFLIAEVSMKVPLIGKLAASMQAIPVGRSQDTLRKVQGRISRSDTDQLVIIGEGTKFTKDVKEKHFINIPGNGELVEVAEIKSDTELVLAHDFKNQKALSTLAKGSAPLRVADRINNSQMFKSVFKHLASDGCIGIFPEGGSHDRTEMLPLKAGVAVMALGTVAEYPDCDLSIVPVGLNYFHPNKFRSRAVIEFGDPFKVDPELVAQYKEGGSEGKKAVSELLSQIADALQGVTINVEDYDTLMLVQACQRLYRPNRYIPLPLVLEFTRRFVQGYNLYKDDARVIKLRGEIGQYNKHLRHLGLRDHQVPTAMRSKLQIMSRIIYRTVLAFVIAVLCIPGTTLFAPVFIAAKIISRYKQASALRNSNVKIKAKDVIATWKILVALWLTPTLYTSYSIAGTWLVFHYFQYFVPTTSRLFMTFCLIYGVLIVISYSSLKMGEAGMDIFRTLWSLVVVLNPKHNDALQQLKEERQSLVFGITELVNELGPEVFPDIGDRIERNEIVVRDPKGDPRTDIGGFNSHHPSGDYNLDEVPIFSTGAVSDSDSRASRTSRNSRAASQGAITPITESTTSGAELNDEITRRIKKAMLEKDE